MKKHEERKHSRLAPSKASTWTVCTASVQLIGKLEQQGLIQEEQSAYAEEGTRAHEVCEALLKGKRPPHNPSSEMLDHCKGFVRYCRGFASKFTQEHSEVDVPLFYLPEDTGAVDYLLIDPARGHIHVIDLKYGAGVAVNVVENKQLAIYARSAIEQYVSKHSDTQWKVSLHIYQPRTQEARDTGIPFSRWDLTLDELNLFTEKEIAVPAQLILDKADHLLKFRPSDSACRWCSAKAHCNARFRYLIDGTALVPLFEGGLPVHPDTLSAEERVELFSRAADIRALLSDVEESLFSEVRAGGKVPGVKLVAGRGSREWLDEEKAEKFLEKSIGGYAWESTLITPAQAEKLIDKDALKPFILRKPGAPKLALADDKRPEWRDVDVEAEFLTVDDVI